MSESGSVTLLRDKHVKYWLRCAQSPLPNPYMPNDSSRMTLAFFIIAALDLLDVLETKITRTERDDFISWIYSCQVPTGGFRGFTGTNFGDERRTENNESWDPATIPSTFFALVILIILKDDLSRVSRRECLEWLPKLQRDNGSFGEILGENESIEGGSDLRFCCCAAGIRYILRGNITDHGSDILDLDTKKLVAYIQSCQTYDGGFAEAPLREAHSGLTYCAVGALSFLGRIPEQQSKAGKVCSIDGIDLEQLLRWLVARQTSNIEEDLLEEEKPEGYAASFQSAQKTTIPAFPQLGALTADDKDDDSQKSVLDIRPEDLKWLGFNGRPNKIADTCYCFWNTGALAMLDRLYLIDQPGLRSYLLGKTQHIIGGFGKAPDELPDVLHAYLGLAALASMGVEGLPAIDATLCISNRARERIQSLPWWHSDHRHNAKEKKTNGRAHSPELDYLAISGG